MKRKICVVVTARPSYSRIQTALQAIKEHPNLELQFVVAASALLDRYGNAVQYIERDGFKINSKVYMILEGENLITSAKSTGLGLVELATVFDQLQPDVVVTIADRFETIATAIAGAYMNIPVAHVQGGEVTGSIDEKVRHAVTKLSDIHLVSTNKARERIIRMGEDPEFVFVTGCPSIDLAAAVLENPKLDFDPFEKYGGVGSYINISDGYVVVMQHPVTTEYEQSRSQITETLIAIRDLNIPALWFWPNVDAGSDWTSEGIRAFRENEEIPNIHFFKNMAPLDFLQIINNSLCVVGNSSVGIRECSFLGIPVVNIGHRQEGRERGHNVIDVGYENKEIANAIKIQGNAGEKIASVLAQVELKVEKRLQY